jgi:dihydrofolate synthase/folylpolyglutamate synthase
MTYDQALAYWFGRVNFERSAPQPGDLKLDRMRALLHRLDDPHEKLRFVHVAGSKGKGSTCAMLESVLRHAGYRTGLFTSPHLEDVRERIQVNRELIPKDELAACMEIVQPPAESLAAEGQPPTFFEVGTAVGFLHFLRQGVDIAIIEVGLGGRFDSTNVITPLVSVITSISLDHTAMLGETVEAIAFEKAGIIKPGVPVVSGVTEPGPRAVIERVANERGAALSQLGFDFNATFGEVPRSPLAALVQPTKKRMFGVLVRTASQEWRLIPRLRGRHQLMNASVAAAVVEQLQTAGFTIPRAAVYDGIAKVDWPARFEVFDTMPRAVLDCAHNVASVETLVDTLAQYADYLTGPRVLIFAVSNDKDVPGMLRVLAPHFAKFYLTRYGDNPRSVPPEQLAAWLPAEKERALCATPADAWRAACADATPDTLVVIAGSVFLAGELRPILIEASRHP